MCKKINFFPTGCCFIQSARKANQKPLMLPNRILHFTYFLILLCMVSFQANAQKVTTIVLDAGHGGHDSGACGKYSREKDITLDIVLKVRDLLQENLKDVKIILTRDDDYFVELYKRARIANENKADLFISIHCNATTSPNAYGTETFVMGLHKSDANLSVAMAENKAILLEEDYVEQYDGFDPNSPEGAIFFSMMQNAFLDNSLLLAGKVQDNFTHKLGMFNRGVKQDGFLVLYKTTMPAVLIETGFLSNPNDEKFLLSESGKLKIANSIVEAVADYKAEIEKSVVKNPNIPNKQYVPDTSARLNDTSSLPISVINDEGIGTVKDLVDFRVQFASFPDKQNIRKGAFVNIPDVREYRHTGQYKYTSGSFGTLDEALEHRKKIVALGYKDAFVVAFKNNERITIEEARKFSGN